MAGFRYRFACGTTLSWGLVVSCCGFVQAQVNVEPRPEGSSGPVARWERGKTNRVVVWAQNNDSHIIDFASWRLNLPSSLAAYLSDAGHGRPDAASDFLGGADLFSGQYAAAGVTSAAYVFWPGDGAPPGRTGTLEYYDIAVDGQAPLGAFDFSLSNLLFRDPEEFSRPSAILDDYSFMMMPLKGDLNADGFVNTADTQVFVRVLLGLETGSDYRQYADWSGNNDGSVDGRDILGFIDAYLTNG
jgi:hypothetical protein